jgi:hypothetical protein
VLELDRLADLGLLLRNRACIAAAGSPL